MDRLGRYPDLHIYHYAPYEPGALKRLMGRYATRENELDRMLRSKLFVDLYGVVRHSVRASVESYSIKKLEPLYGFKRETLLSEANLSLFRVQTRLELDDLESLGEDDRSVVQGYNQDDCTSTWRLRDWLEGLRSQLVAQGQVINRPSLTAGEPSEAISAWQQKIGAVAARLAGDVPADVKQRTPEQHARWLLANLLDWHRREEKTVWWDYFRLAELGAEDLLDEAAGLSGLRFCGVTGGTDKAPVHRYSFPPQDTDLRGDEDLRALGGSKIGCLQEISVEERWIDIKKRCDSADTHPEAVFGHNVVPSNVLRQALLRIGEYVAEHGITGQGEYQAARDLLLRERPRIDGEPLRRAGETAFYSALRIAPRLTGGVLPIQGPPGSGKTYTAARMICSLVQAGRKVGITANSHKVVRNLINAVEEAADELGIRDLSCIQKVREEETAQGRLRFTTDNAALFSAIGTSCQVAGGTAWLWARPEAMNAVDVLFVDEASQISLANIIAVSHAAPRVVLLGDPQQLNQPTQGSHPDGTDVSALDHVLGGEQTIALDRGLFIEETWRLHPSICAFSSEQFYEGRLRSRAGLECRKCTLLAELPVQACDFSR